MSDSRTSLAEVIKKASAKLGVVSTRLKIGVASADELMECSELAFALADTMKLYAETMSTTEPDGRHSFRQPPPST
jgi:hypothetical protein